MPSSLSNVLVHLVFSTKLRHPFLAERDQQIAMHRYLAAISTRLGCPTIAVGGVADHVHVFGRLARTIAVAEWVKELKRVSSLWVKPLAPALADFQWQEGYAAFSVSQASSRKVQLYIEQQKHHHPTVDFQRELRALLAQNQIVYDDCYVWD